MLLLSSGLHDEAYRRYALLNAWAAISLTASKAGTDASRIKAQIHEMASGQQSGQ